MTDQLDESMVALECTLRALCARAGVRRIAIAWKTRTFGEEAFFSRLEDIGEVRTVWRGRVASEAGRPSRLRKEDAPLRASASLEEQAEWMIRTKGLLGITVVEVGQARGQNCTAMGAARAALKACGWANCTDSCLQAKCRGLQGMAIV